MQNTSHAVMAQRIEDRNSLDDFPTPPWATRALIEYIISKKHDVSKQSCMEPACGRGHMSKVLECYFKKTMSSDIENYGYAEQRDFLNTPLVTNEIDWVITNPPFKAAENFVHHGLKVAKQGVAILTRTVFIESVGRYDRLFSDNPPSIFAQFTERVPMVKGRLDKKASTATGYCWLIWDKSTNVDATSVFWIPPCRKKLELEGDYDLPLTNALNKRKRA